MRSTRFLLSASLTLLFCAGCCSFATPSVSADDAFAQVVRPFLETHCFKCHAGSKAKAEMDLEPLNSEAAILEQADWIRDMIDAIDGGDMPPESEPAVPEADRKKMMGVLKDLLRKSAAQEETRKLSIRRLNRFQYNNAVRDLFRLDRDLFPLPEKLMTRRNAYLGRGNSSMPERVEVISQSLNPAPGMRNIKPFPKDLRAAHGFDNQANQLTLSPLLLESFLRLSVSVVESPDFNSKHVGLWDEFFREPERKEQIQPEVTRRLKKFLSLAFRRPVDDATLSRYREYALAKIESGMPFSESMKKVASATLSSPLFLYQYHSPAQEDDLFELASNLSFFLWASCPDEELLKLAGNGSLAKPETFRRTVKRMLDDPKIERFLDTFPAQWMQLENLLAVTPDPQLNRYFSLDKQNPASLQMLAEPLLLFDAVFVEDRSILELIRPKFAYQSDFLKTWYSEELEPPKVDVKALETENSRNAGRKKSLERQLIELRSQRDQLEGPVRQKILENREPPSRKSEDASDAKLLERLKPVAAWEFNGDLKDAVGSFDLTAHGGEVQFRDGWAELRKTYLLSSKLPFDVREKTLEVWCRVPDINQVGGGVMGVQGPGDFFDTIVLGERKPRHWISGSNGFSRTDDFPESKPETRPNEILHLVMVYQSDGSTKLFRNGEPYGKPFRKGLATFPKNQTSLIFGLRHLPPGGNKFLTVDLDRARFYDRALTHQEAGALYRGNASFVTDKELAAAMSEEQKRTWSSLSKKLNEVRDAIAKVPAAIDIQKRQSDARARFDNEIRAKLRNQTYHRVQATDPRYGGIITNAAILSMTSGPKRTHPIARGAWIIEVIFNDPPPPPPNDVPPLNEEAADENLTIREKFAKHRESPDCAGCHSRLDPLGFALENFDITGRWRDQYPNGRQVDVSGTLVKRHDFTTIVEFKDALLREDRRFAKAFTAHLLRFALCRELKPSDSLLVEEIVANNAPHEYRLRDLILAVVQSTPFQQSR